VFSPDLKDDFLTMNSRLSRIAVAAVVAAALLPAGAQARANAYGTQATSSACGVFSAAVSGGQQIQAACDAYQAKVDATRQQLKTARAARQNAVVAAVAARKAAVADASKLTDLTARTAALTAANKTFLTAVGDANTAYYAAVKQTLADLKAAREQLRAAIAQALQAPATQPTA
jgi:hypothetical protein